MRTWGRVEMGRDCWDSLEGIYFTKGKISEEISANFCKKGLDPSGSPLRSGDFREFQNYRADCSVHPVQPQISEKVCKMRHRGFTSPLLHVSLTVLEVTTFAISRSAGRSRSQPSEEVKSTLIYISFRFAFYLDNYLPVNCPSVWTNCFLYVYIPIYL